MVSGRKAGNHKSTNRPQSPLQKGVKCNKDDDVWSVPSPQIGNYFRGSEFTASVQSIHKNDRGLNYLIPKFFSAYNDLKIVKKVFFSRSDTAPPSGKRKFLTL